MGIINQEFYDRLYWNCLPFGENKFKSMGYITNIVEKFNKEEENNMGEIDNILQRYKKYQLEQIDFEADKNMKFLEESSDEFKIAEKIKKQALKELKKAFPDEDEKRLENYIYVSIECLDKTKKEIDIVIDVREDKIKKLEEKIKDVKAMIAMADIFDEKMKVLKNYNIIDKEGRINKC
jgi:hypothetical protein